MLLSFHVTEFEDLWFRGFLFAILGKGRCPVQLGKKCQNWKFLHRELRKISLFFIRKSPFTGPKKEVKIAESNSDRKNKNLSKFYLSQYFNNPHI